MEVRGELCTLHLETTRMWKIEIKADRRKPGWQNPVKSNITININEQNYLYKKLCLQLQSEGALKAVHRRQVENQKMCQKMIL